MNKRPLRPRGKLRAALDAMVWGTETHGPMTYDVAAQYVKLTASAMRKALSKAHVQQYLRQERQVLRGCLNAKTLSRLAELRDQNTNMNAAVAAAKALEQIDDASDRLPTTTRP